ncbi:MAG: DNA primase DnaG [Haloquadratum sp.]|jgi:DNA primase|nr:DNA primase DnaG [Haloferacaceae archaeon]MDR9445340.1 DNA primase DnaG [Haloquadratum sp.]
MMHDVSKYLIHARFAADGVIEQSDVVGAIYGQTEGLLGDRLDFRSLQDASKLGRISVEIQAAGGQSTGTFTLPASLDSVRTAIIAATLETIDQIGPCSARITVETIEDVREAKRSWIVDRATELLHEGFGEGLLDADEILHEVEEAVRIEQITAFEGYPAGPNVADSEAVILVEGRADVLQLLRSGVKNAVAVEGTDIPEALIELTRRRTTTVFFDGDRGGELLHRELAQRGAADYIARAPEGRSVEDLSRKEIHDALRHKLPVEMADPDDTVASAEGTQTAAASSDASAARGGRDGATLYDAQGAVVDTGPLAEVEELLAEASAPDGTLEIDGAADQVILDRAHAAGLAAVVATAEGQVVNQPASLTLTVRERPQQESS